MSRELPKSLLSEKQIAKRVDEMAAQISNDYADSEEVFLVGVLRGAFVFLADLARRLTIPRRIDFIALSSYEEADRRSGAVRLIMDVRSNLAGKDVLIVEDIVDTGHTLAYLGNLLASRGAASVKSCVLVRKPSREEVAVEIDYLGFEIPDAWVVGYGLDYDDLFRTLPYIGVIEPKQPL